MLNRKIACLFFFLVCIIQTSCTKKGGDVPPPVVPAVSIADASADRTTSGSVMHFTLSLNKTTTVPVSVDYSFADGTAKSPTDYTAASGTITIPANQAIASLDVQIKGDPTDTRKNNLEFTVNLNNPKNSTVSVTAAKGTIITENGSNLTTDNTGYTTPANYPGYTLAWSDEFSGNSLDLGSWNQETGNGTNGWGNNELEFYTGSTRNCFVSNGNLVIEARKEPINGFNYSHRVSLHKTKRLLHMGELI
jgi:hypothetical protein